MDGAPAARPTMEREQSLKFMHDLRALIARKGSISSSSTAGFPPAMKVDGKVTHLAAEPSPVHTQEAGALDHDGQAGGGIQNHQRATAISPSGIGTSSAAVRAAGYVGLVLRDHHHHPEVRRPGPAAS